ncbi:hypothetical protein HALA3H3_440011 [Halomonas sp. A3H3]|nr:hypothetical protein HALA3H3_440011 [Halomonas sp. A3H3]
MNAYASPPFRSLAVLYQSPLKGRAAKTKKEAHDFSQAPFLIFGAPGRI